MGGGTVFKITPGGMLTTLHSFEGTDGVETYAWLVQATDGNLYGTTSNGGANDTVFKITPTGTLTTLYSFCSQTGCRDGFEPAGLVQATDGNFYGTTFLGGAFCCSFDDLGYGTVFKITPGGTLTTLYTFCSQSGCTDGVGPNAVIQATDGNFYGTTNSGGANEGGQGTVFKITPGGTLTTVYNFCSQSYCTDGAIPTARLVQGTDGNLYGTTSQGGGLGNYGTAFKITPGGTLTTLHRFDAADGKNPSAGLVQGTDGNFYGTTSYGAYGNWGTVFSQSVGLGPFVETQPTSGRAGATVKILGTNLTGATSVSFNRTPAPFKVVSSIEITTTVPAGATTGKVEVVTPSRTLYSNVPFRVPPSFSPESPGGEGGVD
jgi:uncharacterized repeat protein (TIGR03803 family)